MTVSEWIKSTEQLPSASEWSKNEHPDEKSQWESDAVLIYVGNGVIYIGRYMPHEVDFLGDDGVGVWKTDNWSFMGEKVTHWMYLPDAPQSA